MEIDTNIPYHGTSNGDEEGTQAIDRAARILVGLIESDEYVSLATIIERTGLSKSTAAGVLDQHGPGPEAAARSPLGESAALERAQ